MSRVFYTYGKFCASKPWELMIGFLALSICLFSLSGLHQQQPTSENLVSSSSSSSKNHETCSKDQINCNNEEDSIDAFYVLLIIIARCLAFFYIVHSCTNLYKLGSKYLTIIAVLFSLFSSFFFCTGVISFLNADFNKLWGAITFFFLLMDLPKAVLLAQYALSSKSREDISENIAQGMVILGPTLSLDTFLKLLSIGIGTISKVGRMEELIYFAFLSVIVNYIIFMIFLPACLSLALELSYDRDKPWQLRSLSKVLQSETERATNPVIQRVKLIMSVGLMLIHIISRFPISEINNSLLANSSSNALDQLNIINSSTGSSTQQQDQHRYTTDTSFIQQHLNKWFTISFEQLLLFGLVFVLITKYIYDSKENLEEEVRAHQESTANLNNGSTQRDTISKVNKKNDITNSSIQVNQPSRKVSPAIVITQTESQNLVKSLNNNAKSKSPEKVRKSSLKKDRENKQSNDQPSFFIGASADDSSSDNSDDVELIDKECQTEESNIAEALKELNIKDTKVREFDLLVSLLNSEDGLKQLTDEEILVLVEKRKIPAYKLESILGDPERGVKIRRMFLSKENNVGDAMCKIPYTKYDYSLVMGACCENVIGYMPIPLGTAGPLLLDGLNYQVPLATTEGCLVASTNRGFRALFLAGGVESSIYGDKMTRAPVVRFPTARKAVEALNWISMPENELIIKESFDSTSRFAKLVKIETSLAGRLLYIRFAAMTGDAMGMNMISKGSELSLKKLQEIFPEMEIISLSGNFCTDKKPSSVNWINGRGKSVVCEAVVPAKVVKEILKTSTKNLVSLNISKNLIGSAAAGSIGGFNAHAANIVAAIYIAAGQDPAQVVGSSNCMTLLEESYDNPEDLRISCTMPSIELGTIGGGTILGPQSSCLEILGIRGSCTENPGENARMLARIVCATVLAGELSLLSALASGTLVKSHMKHNRSSISINASSASLANNMAREANSMPNNLSKLDNNLLPPN